MVKVKKKSKAPEKKKKALKLDGLKTAKPSGDARAAKLKIKSGKKSILMKKSKLKQRSSVIVRTPASSGNHTRKPVVVERQAPIKLTKEMQEIRSRLQTMLTDMRRDIDHEVRGASERDLAHINDTSDMASDSAEGDLALRIAESETAEAGEIERAIEKIDSGTYGICEICNQPIGADRLKFLPYVTLCIKCQALAEIRRREDGDELDDLAEGAEADAENN
jgi:DnaK suppressor protein